MADPKQKEAEEIIELAKEIVKERHNAKDRPDVIPRYIQDRPAPRYQDPHPKIGPLAANGNDYEAMTGDLLSNEYEALKIGQENSGFSSEDAYLDLEQTQEIFKSELANDNGTEHEYREIEPDPIV